MERGVIMDTGSCEFCLLAANAADEFAKEIIVHETGNVIAFKPMSTNSAAHIMVIPKVHVVSILDASDALLSELMAVIKTVASDIIEKHGACRVMTNIGDYQHTKHLHWHITYEKR